MKILPCGVEGHARVSRESGRAYKKGHPDMTAFELAGVEPGQGTLL